MEHPRKLLVLAGGGTGGHLFPALAVAEAMCELDGQIDVQFYCTTRAIDAEILDRYGIERIVQPVRPLSMKPWHWPAFLRAWRASCRLCQDRMRRRRPAVVLGSGGFGSGPAVHAARRLGVPRALLNPDVVPGRGNRHLARMADAVFVQWPEAVAHFADPSVVHVTGCPVRREFAAVRREEGIRLFGLDPARRTLLVTGASQGARTLNEAVVALLGELRRRRGWQVLHLSGRLDFARVAAAYRAESVAGRVCAFTHQMPAALAAADLVVSRAGASSLAELTASGKPAILLPYPYHRDQHQWANAQVLVRAGAARAVRDCRDATGNSVALGRVLLPLMDNPAELETMAEASARMARRDAAIRVARILLDLAGSNDPRAGGRGGFDGRDGP